MTNVVRQSFIDDGSTPTLNEQQRRSKMIIELFSIMRRDTGYSLTRTLDALPTALRAKLDGAPWEPSTKAMWGTSETVVDDAVDELPDNDSTIWTPERARMGLVE